MTGISSQQDIPTRPAWSQFFSNPPFLSTEDPEHFFTAYCRRSFPPSQDNSSLELRIERFVIEQLKIELEKFYDEGKLSRYQIIYLQCKEREVLLGRNIDVKNELQLFKRELVKNPRNYRLQSQALDIYVLWNKDPFLKRQAPNEFWHFTIENRKNEKIEIHCFLWAAHMPGMTAFLFGENQKNPVRKINIEILKIIDKYLRTGCLEEVSIKILFKLYKISKILEFRSLLEKAVAQLKLGFSARKIPIQEKNFSKILQFSFDRGDDAFFRGILDSCVQWILEQSNHRTNNQGLLINYKLVDKALVFSIKVTELNDFVEKFLKLCSGHIFECEIRSELVTEVLRKNHRLPKVLKVLLSNDGPRLVEITTLKEIRRLFPNLQRFQVSRFVFEHLTKEDFENLENIEYLEVVDNGDNIASAPLYYLFDCPDLTIDLVNRPLKNVKVISFLSNTDRLPYAVKKRNNTVFFMGDLKNSKDSYNLSDFQDLFIPPALVKFFLLQVTKSARSINLEGHRLDDGTVKEIISMHNGLKFLNLSGCTLQEETADFIARQLPGLEYLNLKSCEFSEKTVLAFARHLSKLKYLNLKLSRISATIISQLKNLLPECHFIFAKEAKRIKVEVIELE